MAPQRVYRKSAMVGWCLYDWANSAFPTIIMTFIFATYFTEGIAPSTEEGTALWGQNMAIAGFILAVCAPVFGAIADYAGHRGRWLLIFTVICIGATALLWFATPEPSSIFLASICAIIGVVAFEFSMVFYNAYLPEIAPRSHWGRISGWGWGLGYIGGLSALAIALFGFVQTETPLFGISKEEAGHVRATFMLVAIWMSIFVIPTFLFLPKTSSEGMPLRQAIPTGLKGLLRTLKRLKDEKTVLRYLIARMIYTDGLNTLFIFGGIYAAGTFGMELADVILFGILMNVTAGIGAAVFAWLDDFWGPKKVLIVTLLGLTLLCIAGAVVEDASLFWGVGIIVGLFLGPTQSASRSMMARLAPAGLNTEYFGLYALSGKATAFLGPWLLGMVTLLFDSQRAGMSVIVVFLLVGTFLLWRIDLSSYAGAEGRMNTGEE